MRTISFWIGAALAGLVGSTAFAQENRAARNAGLPRLSEVQPVPQAVLGGFFRDFRLTLDGGYSYTKRRNQPTELKQSSYSPTLGLSFRMGQMGFAAFSASYARHDITSNIPAFALPVNATSDTLSFDGAVGITPLPFLRLGVLAGYGNGDSSYAFTGIPAPAIGARSDTHRFGGFIGASYVQGRWLFSADATIVVNRNHIDYDPGNIPPRASWGSTLALIQLGVGYRATERLRLSAAVSVNQVLSQSVAGTEPKLDANWFTLQIGAAYDLAANWEINVRALTWLGNHRISYNRVSAGVAYKF